ncbi:HAD family hydrolase [Haloarchaeobius sp. HME9146]|uniref:HAD family hydrolase n=1 Tax=Haloarchaeobius sp. HME9146 TaxID=2978732 RepID=UPI0021C13829|nr:HAD family hydrolase [Haloarchaeobius sp. HME9146]MCT9095777.1 HAD family hydrolase [Haloarchaeobius sp. HME9146]
MTGPATVLFDLDLTLCASTQDRDTLLSRTFDAVGVDQYCEPSDLGAVVGEVETAETEHEFYASIFAAAADRAGVEDVPADALASAHADLVDHSAVEFCPGAERALEHARTHAESVGLVTNGGEESQTTKLESLGIADAFDTTVFVDPRNGVEPKPHPAPFERALGALDAVPEATIHVGDSLRSDVAGANAMGIGSVWVPYDAASHDGNHDPSHQLDSLHEFETVF